MNIKHTLTRLWQRLTKAQKHPVLSADIEFAFSCAGKDYYRFKDVQRMPARRYSEFLLKWQELDMSVTREWLRNTFCEEMLKELSGISGNVNLANLSRLTYELKSRIELAAPEDSVYNACSVYFFPLDENLLTFDYIYNRAKVEAWKAAEEPADFFFRKPVSELIGWANFSEQDIRNSLENLRIAQALIERQFQRTSKAN